MNKNTSSTKPPETMQSLLDQYIQRLKENREMENRLQDVRLQYKTMKDESDKLEDHLKAIQNTGQLIGEILKNVDQEKCKINRI
jgi:26S proteasome regulatory subunit T4